MKGRLLVVSLLVIVSLLVSCATPTPTPVPTPVPTATPKPTSTPVPTPTPPSISKPTGPVFFTITGDVTLPNADGAVQVDEAGLAPYIKEYTIDDPWAGKGMKYSGVLLSELWALAGAGPTANGVTLTATDGMRLRIPKEDLLKWPILVVTQLAGKALVAEQGGPAKLAFPPEARRKKLPVIAISDTLGPMLVPAPDLLLSAPRSGDIDGFQTLTVPMAISNAIGEAVVFLAHSNYITGAVLPVDGGFTAVRPMVKG